MKTLLVFLYLLITSIALWASIFNIPYARLALFLIVSSFFFVDWENMPWLKLNWKKLMKKRIRKIIIYYRAHNGYAYWRVTYNDVQKNTRLLKWGEAYPLQQIFGGKLWIDYSAKI